jgi:hypothetical protein
MATASEIKKLEILSTPNLKKIALMMSGVMIKDSRIRQCRIPIKC